MTALASHKTGDDSPRGSYPRLRDRFRVASWGCMLIVFLVSSYILNTRLP